MKFVHLSRLWRKTLYTLLHCTVLDFLIQGPVKVVEQVLHTMSLSPLAYGVQGLLVVLLIGLLHFEEKIL